MVSFDGARVYELEQSVIEARNKVAWRDEKAQGIGLCLAGGGIRAASFHAGVLWRLAELGLLRKVDYVSAVSGGAYSAAAFATHARWNEMSPEATEADADRHYRVAVARLLGQMQQNCGFLTSFAHSLWRCDKRPSEFPHGSAVCRIFDLPILLGMLLGMPAINLCRALVYLWLPLAFFVSVVWGDDSRRAICRLDKERSVLVPAALAFIALTVVLVCCDFCAKKRLQAALKAAESCRVKKQVYEDEKEINKEDGQLLQKKKKKMLSAEHKAALKLGSLVASRSTTYLWLRSAKAITLTMSIILVLILLLLNVAHEFEVLVLRGDAHSSRTAACACVDFFNMDTHPTQYKYPSVTSLQFPPPDVCESYEQLPSRSSVVVAYIVYIASIFLLVCMGLAYMFSQPKIIVGAVRLVPIAFLLLISVALTQWSIYGPLLNDQQYLWYRSFAWTATRESRAVLGSAVIAVVMLIFQPELLAAFHFFYAKSLTSAFFADAEDANLAQLARDDRVPFLILGATTQEYRTTTDSKNDFKTGQSPFQLTPLTFGGERVGYATTPPFYSLSKAMAVSAAATDGFCLGLQNSGPSTRRLFRVLLKGLNWSMGDNFHFVQDASLEKRAPDKFFNSSDKQPAAEKQPSCCSSFTESNQWSSSSQLRRNNRTDETAACCAKGCCTIKSLREDLVARLPATVWLAIVYCLVGASALFLPGNSRGFGVPRALCYGAAGLYLSLLLASFLPASWPTEGLFRAAMGTDSIATIHELVDYPTLAAAGSPPPFIPLSDGGLLENLGVLELLRRRRRWILVSDTGEDPNFKFTLLLDSLQMAYDRGIVTAYLDIETPARCPAEASEFGVETIKPLLRECADRDYLRIRGIYCGGDVVDIIVIKMRGDGQQVEPLLTTLETLGNDPTLEDFVPYSTLKRGKIAKRLSRLSRASLNGLCCDCCQGRVNALGGEFPHTSMLSNLFLTPLQFANLARLGKRHSESPLNVLATLMDDERASEMA